MNECGSVKFPLKKPDSISVSRGRKHFIPLSVSELLVSSRSLSLLLESPSPTVGNTMSQRMAHWREWHGQPHRVKGTAWTLFRYPDFVNMFLRSLGRRWDKLSETIIRNSKTDLLFGKKHIYGNYIRHRPLPGPQGIS